MIKSKTAQLIFQSSYCSIGLIGVIASLGFFEYTFYSSFYTQFTNLSNYLCVAVMLIELIQTARKQGDSYVSAVPKLKFIGMMAILLTFLVFNLLLAGAADRDPAMNFKVASVVLHVILPIMYIADWVLFYERKTVKLVYPFLSAAFPAVYIVFIYLRAWMLDFDPNAPMIYPYFFLNLETQGLGGVIRWVLILLVAFIVVGFAFWGLDNIGKKRSRINSGT